jgi:hypothetical protein
VSPRQQFPGLALGWAVALSSLAASAAPPRELTVSQWADDERHISPESGARITGRWKTSTAPYTRRPMDVGGVDHPCGSVWMRWAAKVGKTQVPLNVLGHMICTAPRASQVFCPTDGKRKDFVREIFEPTVRATPALNQRVLATRARSGEGSTTAFKRFRGGFLKIGNAGSEPELQQTDVGLIVFEEPSSYLSDVGGRGPPVRQARARMFAWADDAKEIGSGTPKFVGDCVVTAEVMRRTRELYYLPCPYCGARQVLKWENMERHDGRPYFRCLAETCARLIGHEHKRWMLDQADAGSGGWLACFYHADKDGRPDEEHENQPPPEVILAGPEWDFWFTRRGPDVGTHLEGRDPSFDGIWQAYSPFTTWAKVFEAYDEAIRSGNPDDLVTFWQQVLGLPFEPAYEKPARRPAGGASRRGRAPGAAGDRPHAALGLGGVRHSGHAGRPSGVGALCGRARRPAAGRRDVPALRAAGQAASSRSRPSIRAPGRSWPTSWPGPWRVRCAGRSRWIGGAWTPAATTPTRPMPSAPAGRACSR